jgi:hypothetical protein
MITDGPVVINRHHYRGRPMPEPSVYIGRGTPLGNEVSRREDGEEVAMRRYRTWLWAKVEERDANVLGALNAIGPDHHLVCSCAPSFCHGDVALEVWHWLAGKGEW